MRLGERPTARSIVHGVICGRVYNKTAEADYDCDQTKGENTD
jgi:hypothetical protein